MRYHGELSVTTFPKDVDVFEHKGAWRRVTPEELVHGYILAIARDIAPPTKPLAKLKQWRFHLLTTSFNFRIVPSDEELFWLAAKFREDIRSQYNVVVRTALQRIIEIGRYKHQKEAKVGKISNSKLAELYSQNLKIADGAEQITEKYITISLRVNEYLLSIQSVKNVIINLEEKMGQGSPFNSVYRLEAFYSRTRDHAVLVWIFNCIYDFYESNSFNCEFRMSVESLTGGGGGKGDIDLWTCKLRMHDYLLGGFLEAQKVSSEVKSTIKRVLQSHSSYRTSTISDIMHSA
jgi:hypothetical protein